jgi:hypothetical protein
MRPEAVSCEIADSLVEDLLDKGRDIIYENYLQPKIRPFTALKTALEVTMPSRVTTSFKNKAIHLDLRHRTRIDGASQLKRCARMERR